MLLQFCILKSCILKSCILLAAQNISISQRSVDIHDRVNGCFLYPKARQNQHFRVQIYRLELISVKIDPWGFLCVSLTLLSLNLGAVLKPASVFRISNFVNTIGAIALYHIRNLVTRFDKTLSGNSLFHS